MSDTSLSTAERMFRRNRKSQGRKEITDSSDGQSAKAITETHKRLFYVIDQLQGMIPAELRDHPMAKMLTVFARESKKDIRTIDEEFIRGLSREVGKAFAWVADGEMSDVEP